MCECHGHTHVLLSKKFPHERWQAVDIRNAQVEMKYNRWKEQVILVPRLYFAIRQVPTVPKSNDLQIECKYSDTSNLRTPLGKS